MSPVDLAAPPAAEVALAVHHLAVAVLVVAVAGGTAVQSEVAFREGTVVAVVVLAVVASAASEALTSAGGRWLER